LVSVLVSPQDGTVRGQTEYRIARITDDLPLVIDPGKNWGTVRPIVTA
jgi:hypothetical protein